MDATLRSVINNALAAFLEPLNKGDVELSVFDGMHIRGLKVKPGALNYMLEKNGVDARVEDGSVGEVRLAYSALPGTVTLQLDRVNVRVRPHAMKMVGKALVKGITDLCTSRPQCVSQYACNVDPLLVPPTPVVYEPDPHSRQWVESAPKGLCGLAGPPRRMYMRSPRRLPQSISRTERTSPAIKFHVDGRAGCGHCNNGALDVYRREACNCVHQHHRPSPRRLARSADRCVTSKTCRYHKSCDPVYHYPSR